MKINEITMIDDTKFEIPRLYKFITTNCKQYLSECPNFEIIYRGVRNPPIRKSKLGFENLSQVFFNKPRQNRKPMSTGNDIHLLIDKCMKKAGLIATRTNSFFTSNERQTASFYGRVYVVYPVGKFDYSWSPIISDLYGSTGNFIYPEDRTINYEKVFSSPLNTDAEHILGDIIGYVRNYLRYDENVKYELNQVFTPQYIEKCKEFHSTVTNEETPMNKELLIKFLTTNGKNFVYENKTLGDFIKFTFVESFTKTFILTHEDILQSFVFYRPNQSVSYDENAIAERIKEGYQTTGLLDGLKKKHEIMMAGNKFLFVAEDLNYSLLRWRETNANK